MLEGQPLSIYFFPCPISVRFIELVVCDPMAASINPIYDSGATDTSVLSQIPHSEVFPPAEQSPNVLLDQ